jgi:hypothetical protein
MHTNRSCPESGCPLNISRRKFLATAGAWTVATKLGLLDFASSLFAAEAETDPAKKPVVRAAFVRPDAEKYWMGWPGAAYDIKARQRQYTKIMTDAAEKYGVNLQVIDEPLHSPEKVSTFLENLKSSAPDGLIVTSMCLHHPGFRSWSHTNNIAKNRGEIPTIIFSPMGTSFTKDLQGCRNIPGVFLAATQDLDWLDFGMRMLSTIQKMKNTRLLIMDDDKTKDRKLDVIGTTLHYVPRSRWPEEFHKADTTDEMRNLSDFYTRAAKMIVEPKPDDVLNSAKNYVVAKRLMAAENCQGISVDCLPLVRDLKIPCPPCIAWLRLNDEGSVGCCEADWNSAISLRLISLLFDRPGFMQDPAPNTVKNTLMGAHCSCPTRLDGFDKPPAPFILRNHSESEIGVSPQVLWRIGQKVTVMEFSGPEKIIVGTGRVLRNIDTPPAGGCRTSVELEMDDVPDVCDTRGFHQLFVYGDLELPLRAYCQLAGIKAEDIYRPRT